MQAVVGTGRLLEAHSGNATSSLEGTSPELFEQTPLEESRLLLRLILSHGLFLRELCVSTVFSSFLVVVSW